jgi:hypothetical protein
LANIMILHPNRADAATLSGGDWQIPLATMQTRLLRRVARSASLAPADTQFEVELDRVRSIRAVALINHNLSRQARVRVRGSADGDFDSPKYDSGWIGSYPALYSSSSLNWEDANFWDGRPLAEDLDGFTRSFVHILPATVFATYWLIEVDDRANLNGYVDIGRLFMAGGWQPSSNYVYGGSLAFETGTSVTQSLAGAEFFDRREPYRVLRCAFEYLPQQEALEQGLEIQRRAGIDQEVFVMADPSDTKNVTRLSFLGRLRSLTALEQVIYQRANLAFEIKEIL